MWRSRTFWRLFGSIGLLLLCSIGLLGWVVIGRVERQVNAQTEANLRTKAILVREVVTAQPLPDEFFPPLQKRVTSLGQEIATRITLLADDGRVLADSEEDPRAMENHADRPEVEAARREGFGSSTRFSATLGQPMTYAALHVDGRGPVAFVRVALHLADVEERLGDLRRLVWTAAAGTALAALALAFWLAGRITGPLRELTEGAERIAAGGFGHKVFVGGRDEVGALAHTFNHMSARLADQFTQLAEDGDQLRAILSGMVEGVVALDGAQRILFANDRAARLLEFTAAAPVGRFLWEVVRHRPLLDVLQRTLGREEPTREDLVWNGAPARSLTVHAARLPGSPPRGAVLVLHDTTELRRLERLRQEFVANVSHELKTPLSVIKACVETLQDGAVEDSQHRDAFLQRIAEQSDRLYALILDLLSLARIESGEETLDFQAVPVAESVQACLERHWARAEARRQTLVVGGRETLLTARSASKEENNSHAGDAGGSSAMFDQEATVWADEEAFGQVLDNLVDNAVKYTPEGGRIRVGWQVEGDQICLEVEDTGIGIPEQDLPRIFERFYRVHKARSRELGGTGLGLSIVKHLVGAMHGNVRAASRVGQGTTFLVRLPRAPRSVASA
jgi:two-component system, OmpR family, phosphate regulon sensor histidine kinase PhoR